MSGAGRLRLKQILALLEGVWGHVDETERRLYEARDLLAQVRVWQRPEEQFELEALEDVDLEAWEQQRRALLKELRCFNEGGIDPRRESTPHDGRAARATS